MGLQNEPGANVTAASVNAYRSLPPSPLVLDGGRVIDPSVGVDRIARILVIRGRVAAIDPPDGDIPDDARWIDATGNIVAPGLVDLGAELRQPGREEDETIQTGS